MHSCGKPFHIELGFTGAKTAQAALYPHALCFAWARALLLWSQTSARIQARAHGPGAVMEPTHVLGGVTVQGAPLCAAEPRLRQSKKKKR